ncbi:MAG: CCA tRNA nucleotidyltransferase [Paracoccaceae bacterium]
MKLTADWLQNPDVQALFRLLDDAGHSVHAVGGCVRNALLGVPVADIDFASSAPPETVGALAKAEGYRVLPTGIDHGTVTVLIGGSQFEVTTWRKDVATDGRRATIAYATRLKDDAARRDFTINALYVNAQGAVLDPVGGLADIAAKRLRFIGNPAARIAEDYLRSLRFFRFFAWYGEGVPDAAALAAIAAAVPGLAGLSAERVGAEMARLLAAPDPVAALDLMAQTGVLGALLAGAACDVLGALMQVEQAENEPPAWLRRLAALGNKAGWAERLRLSKADAKHLAAITSAATAQSLAVAAQEFGAPVARDAALLEAARGAGLPPDWRAEIARGAAAVFPLRAADFPQHAGPALGAALKAARARWLASDLRASKAALLAG